MPALNFQKKHLPTMEYIQPKIKKTCSKSCFTNWMCTKSISPQINESTIRLLNRHGIEVISKRYRLLWFIKSSFR